MTLPFVFPGDPSFFIRQLNPCEFLVANPVGPFGHLSAPQTHKEHFTRVQKCVLGRSKGLSLSDCHNPAFPSRRFGFRCFWHRRNVSWDLGPGWEFPHRFLI